ncbi:MAG: CcmD family protein [Eggerthellaceae bacterium]|nr:CcmD family protein [Eggerthellaceae bacterium]
MNSVLQEIYATILPSAPFIIAAYVLVWLALFVYILFSARRFKAVEEQLALVERSMGAEKVSDATSSVLKESQGA